MSEQRKRERKVMHWQRWPKAVVGQSLHWFTPCGYPRYRGLLAIIKKTGPLRLTTWRKNVTCKRCLAAMKGKP